MRSIITFADWIGNKYVPTESARWLLHQALLLMCQPGSRERERLALYLSKEKRFIFLINPLVASQSMSAALIDYAAMENLDLAVKVHEVTAGPEDDYSDYFKFCFVRNPWERVVSCFHKKVVNANTAYKLLLLSRHPKIKLGICFEEFVDFLCSPDGMDEVSDAHWMSQSRLLSAPDGSPLWDFAGKLEEFPNSLQEAMQASGLVSLQMPTIGASEQMKTPRAHRDYRAYFNQATWDRIAQRYAKDIEVFGYNYNYGR